MKYSILIPEYNVWFQKEIFEQYIYHALIQNARIYKLPIYTLKDLQKFFPSLSYRVLNDWDKKKLISGSRKNQDFGWRKFSAIDIIKFFIITDLRKYGMPIPRIKKIIHDLSHNFVIIKDPNTDQDIKTEYLHFEYFVILSSIGEKILLLIDDRQYTLLNNEVNMLHLISSKDFYAPYLLLPFYDYVKKFFKQLTIDIKIKKYSTLHGLLQARFDLKERIILDTIRNDKYREITITKKNKGKMIVTAESVRSGKFTKKELLDLIDSHDYQDVKISKVDGRIIKIYQKEKIRL